MVKFTFNEVRDLIISMVVIALAFAILFRKDYDNNFLLLIPATLIGVVPGFLFHEMGHKFMAIRYGFDAEFKMFIPGLFFALASSFFGIIFAAPGAVHIKGDKEISDKEGGKIAIVGPLINIILALLFLAVSIVSMFIGMITYIEGNYAFVITVGAYEFSFWEFLSYIGFVGFFVNGSMAALNMIPWSLLDGSKVFDWNKYVWGIVAIISFLIGVIPIILFITY
jgi:Zn-dependent protease